MLAGVGLLVVCCSSSMAALAMGGGEETPADATTTAAGAGAGAGAGTEDTTPSMLKCINTQKRGDMGWVFKARVKTEAEARALCPIVNICPWNVQLLMVSRSFVSMISHRRVF
tara:strand:+ start:57 stop:395 length:339 start_codon:yes stop_codon:yes gene_type:complete